MMYPDREQFDACLPGSKKTVRIRGLHDAQVFTRRWTIRDKDPRLKALMRRLDRAHGAEMSTQAMLNFKSALASRGLFGQPGLL